MAEGTVDNLNIQLSADADQAVKSLNNLASTLRSINTAFTKDISGMRKFSKEIGTLNSALKGLNNIKTPDLSKLSKAMKSLSETKTSGAKSTADDVKDIVNSLKGLGNVNFNESGITKLTNSLKRLAQVDMSAFDVSKFKQITESVYTLGNMPDVSSSVNRFVSSLSRLANAGEKTGQSANSVLKLGEQTRLAAQKLQSVGAINDDVNLFVQSIGRLASAGGKTSQTASGLSALSKETLEFFKAMQNAPRVSENTIRMTQALAQLASAGGRVGTATNSVTSAFEKLSKAGTSTMNALKKASSGIVSALQRITGAGKGVNGLTLSLGNLLKTAVGFNIGYGLLNFGKSMFELGSDVTEVENVVDVAFGGMAQSAYDFAKTAQEQFGLSELSALRYSGILMSMFNASGIAQRDAAEMSTTLTGLAGDLASFYNIDQDDAFTKLRSALAGEVEPMRALGVDMTVASMEAYALSQGITESWQSMSQAEKVMVRYNYLMSVTSAQQNDFQRTQASFANQTRLLTLNIQQLAATIGQGLIAAVLPAVTALNKLFAVLQKAAIAVRNFFYVLTGYEGGGSSGIVTDISTAMDDIADSSGAATGGISDAADAAEDLKDQLTLLPFDQINKLSDVSVGDTGTGGGGGSGTGIGDSIGGIDDTLSDLGGKQPEKYVNAWAERIRAAFLAEDWEQLGYEIADGLNRGLQKVYDVISWDNVGPKITAFTTAFTETFNSFAENFNFELLGRTIGTGINTIVNTLNQLIDGIDWKNLGRRFAVGFNGLVDEVNWFELGRLIGNKFMIAWDTLLGIVTTLDWGEVGRSLADGFNGMLSEISLGDIGTTIGTIVAGIIEMFREFFANADWSEVISQIKEGISNALSAASDGGQNDGIIAGLLGIGAIGGISKIAGPIISTISTISDLLGKTGLTKAAGDAASAIGGPSGLAGVISKVAPKLSGMAGPIGIAITAILAIGTGIKDLWDTSETFRNNISDMWDRVSGAFVDAKEKIWDKSLKPLIDSFGDFFDSIYDLYDSSGLKDIFQYIVEYAANQLSTTFQIAFGIIGDVIEGVAGIIGGIVDALSGLLDFVTGVFTGDWDKAWTGIKDFFFGILDAISSQVEMVMDIITTIIDGVVDFFGAGFQSASDLVKSAFSGIGDFFEGVWDGIQKIFSPVAQTFKNWFGNAYTNVKNAWSNANIWFSNKWGQIKTVFSPVASNFKTWFSNAYTNVKNAWSSSNTWFNDKWSSIKNVFSDVPSFFKSGFQKAYDSVKSIWYGIGNYFKNIANNIISPIEKAVNGIISGVNWVLKKVGSKTRLSSWSAPKFASGSKGIQRDTLGVVNDQKGATYKELIVPPNGKPFIPKGRNVMLPLEKGTKIMPAKQTKDFMKSMGIPHFKSGIGDFISGAWSAIKDFTGDVFDYLTNPGDIVKIAIDKFMNLSSIVEPWLSVAGGIANTVLGGITDFISGIFDNIVPKVNYNPSAGVEQWRSLAKYALQLTGQYTEANLDRLLMQMQTESGGNLNAINNWDINAKNGTPSKGLMQVIDPTFQAYKYPGYNNIWDPLSNILASIRYTVSRYGSLARGWQGHGYAEGIGTITISDIFKNVPKLASGGMVMPGQLFVANERGPELVGRYGNRTAVMNNDQITASVSDGVEDGVYRAMMSAMQSNRNSGSGDMHITIDIGGERFVTKIVSQYNKMKKGDPNFGFVV